QRAGLVVAHVLGQHARVGLQHLAHRRPRAAVYAVLDHAVVHAHVDVGVDAEGRVRAAAQDLRCVQADGGIVRVAGVVPGQRVLPAGLHAQACVAVWRAVGHGRVGHAGGILHAGPERAACRADVVFVQGTVAVPAGVGIV